VLVNKGRFSLTGLVSEAVKRKLRLELKFQILNKDYPLE
jgi:hypothetical protein